MNKMSVIKAAWEKAHAENSNSQAFQKIVGGTLTKQEYGAILRQIFHQVREHPQALVTMTGNLRGNQRRLVKDILSHASSEVNHDQLAISDLKALGEDTQNIEFERPLPMTSAILGFMNSLLANDNPIAFLGYLFHLEFVPTQSGPAYLKALKSAGVPDGATSFLSDHSIVDVGHNKLMEKYVDELVKTEDDLASIIYAARATARLYALMLDEAIDAHRNKADYGINHREKALVSEG